MSGAISFEIRQFRRARFSALYNDRCALVVVRSGLKRIGTDLGAMELETGMLGVIAPRLSLTIENCPASSAPYTAQLLAVAWRPVAADRPPRG